jgi:4-hydroxy-2-oxoheptanedioate aldolase
MKYAPEGIRGYNPFTRAAFYSNPATNEFGKLNNRFGFSSVIVENESSLKDLDKILNIPDLDMLYVGVYDMAVALGCKGDTTHPRMVEFVETTVRRIRDAGKAAGMMVKNQSDIKYALSLGANVLVYGVDTFMIHGAASAAVNMFRTARGQAPEENH